MKLRARSLSAAGLLAAGLLLSACGSNDSEGTAASSVPSSSPAVSVPSSAPASSPAAADATTETFCKEQAALTSEIGPELQSVGTDPDKAATTLSSISDKLGGIEAPADIAPQWTSLKHDFDELQGLLQDATSGKTTDSSKYLEQAQSLQSDLTENSQAVSTWAQANC